MGKIRKLAAGLAVVLGLSQPSLPVAEGGHDYQGQMVELVCRIHDYAQQKAPGFELIANGGSPLYLAEDGNTAENVSRLLQAVDGQMAESVFYRWDTEQDCAVETPAEETAYFLRTLAVPRDAGLKVLSLDYVDTAEMEEDSYRQNAAQGYTGWASYRRELDSIPSGGPCKESASDITRLGEAKNYLVLLNPGRFASREDYLAGLRSTDYDLLIVDLYYGTEKLSTEEVESLKWKKNGGRRLVFAYMSVGEAETYRPYWQAAWEQDPPDWIEAKNEDWEDNYKVKYWRSAWQKLLFGRPESYLDQILASGFDGAFLDVVDAYYYFMER